MIGNILRAGFLGCLLAATATGVNAQTALQKVTYPDGRVAYEPVGTYQATTAPVPATISAQPLPQRVLPWDCAPTAACVCDPCKSPSQPVYCPGCKPGCNWPQIEYTPLDCPPATITRTPIDSTPIGTIDEDEEVYEEFYTKCEWFDSTIEVPYTRKATRTRIEFKTVTYTHKCCKYTVCVPCACVKECKTDCAKKKIHARLIRKTRHDGKIDVYAVGVKGFPKEWVVCFELPSIDEFNRLYPGVALTPCPAE